MHPELITLPGGFSIKTYGFFMMVGFLSGVWFAMRRASRVKADPDVVLDMALWGLIFGIAGARAFFVIHYWKTQFADAPNPLIAVIDITAGGLEFLGGFLGASAAILLYGLWKRYPMRVYLDIAAPSAMWGLAVGRIGCFFNGCCFGAVAWAGDGQHTAAPWAVEFPYGSPAHLFHWEQRRVSVPAELMAASKEQLLPYGVPDTQLNVSVEKREEMVRRIRDLEQAYNQTADKPDSPERGKLRRELEAARKKAEAQIGLLLHAQKFPSRQNPRRPTSVSELEHLAAQCRSLPVHPAQLYATVGAMLLSIFLSTVFYRRKRHGVVIGLLLVLYPVQRVFEEMIRADNPKDVAGLTLSQSVSAGLFVLGLIYLLVLYKRMPLRSPAAVARVEEPDAPPAASVPSRH